MIKNIFWALTNEHPAYLKQHYLNHEFPKTRPILMNKVSLATKIISSKFLIMFLLARGGNGNIAHIVHGTHFMGDSFA